MSLSGHQMMASLFSSHCKETYTLARVLIPVSQGYHLKHCTRMPVSSPGLKIVSNQRFLCMVIGHRDRAVPVFSAACCAGARMRLPISH